VAVAKGVQNHKADASICMVAGCERKASHRNGAFTRHGRPERGYCSEHKALAVSKKREEVYAPAPKGITAGWLPVCADHGETGDAPLDRQAQAYARKVQHKKDAAAKVMARRIASIERLMNSDRGRG
jgi:hypothetical protein